MSMNRQALVVEQLSCISIKAPEPPPVIHIKTREELLMDYARKKFRTTWRIKQLAVPNRPVKKYVAPPDVYKSPLGPGVMNLELCPFRSENLALTEVRKLRFTKAMYKTFGQKYTSKIDKTIAKSWASIYNYYKRCYLKRKEEESRLSLKGKPPKKPKTKEQIEKEFQEWLLTNSLPKPTPPPAPLPPRRYAPLQKLMERGDVLAVAKPLRPDYLPPRVLPAPVPKSALTYQVTEHTANLTVFPKRILDLANYPGPRKLGVVEKGALKAKPTPRILELATPAVKQKADGSDEKEDPCAISPNALKYVATARIKELAKPIER